jgi:hypothetical protein
MDSFMMNKDPINVPKLQTDNFEVWFEQLCLALSLRGLKKNIDFPNYLAFCKAECLDLSGFREEIFLENGTNKSEEDFLKEVIFVNISKSTGEEVPESKKTNFMKQRKYFIDMVENFDEERKFKNDNGKCMSFIIATISDPIRDRIKGEESPFSLIKKLELLCPSSSLGQIINFKKQIYHAVMAEKESLISFLDRIEALNRKIVDSKLRLSEIDLWMAVVMNIHSRYSTLATVLISGKFEEVKLDKLRSQFANEDARKIKNSDSKFIDLTKEETEKALGMLFNPKGKCFKCGKEGHHKIVCERFSTEKERKEFRRKKNRERRENSKSSTSSSISSEEDRKKRKETHNLNIYSKKKDERFFFDNACPEHVTNDLNDLQNVVETRYKVKSGGPKDKGIYSKRKGSLVLKTSTGVVELDNVFYVEGYSRKLISMKRLDDQGAQHSGKNGKIQVQLDGRTIFDASLDHSIGLYAINCRKAEVKEKENLKLSKEKTKVSTNQVIDSCF